MAALPEPWKSLSARIYKIEEQLRKIRNSSPFSGTGLSIPEDGTTQVDGNLHVLGDFTADGKVSNDALTNPVAPGVVWADLHNFSLSTTLTNKLTATITVPAGFTTAAVSVVGRTYVINSNSSGGYDGAGGDYIYAQTNVSGFNGNTLPLAVSGNGGSGAAVSPFSTVLTGLTPGGTFTVQMAASTAFAAIAADPSNTIELSGSILWFR